MVDLLTSSLALGYVSHVVVCVVHAHLPGVSTRRRPYATNREHSAPRWPDRPATVLVDLGTRVDGDKATDRCRCSE